MKSLRRSCTIPLILAIWFTILTKSALGGDGTILISGARLLEAGGDRWLEGRELLIRDGRIEAIAPAGHLDDVEAVQRLALSGYHVLPGLIDLHTHLLLHPYDEASWNDQVLKESLELRTIRAEGAGGPRVLAVTRALVATGCYGPSGFDPRWDVPKGAQVADGVDGVRRAVREQVAGGADWIKVYADYPRRAGDPATATFSQVEMDAIVGEASSAGLSVAAHATSDEAIRRAVRAGVKTIEHGYSVGAEVLSLMRDRGVVLCPTLAASEAMARYAGWSSGDDDHERIKTAREMFERALKSGVTIACGSDAGVFAHGENVREIELMVEYGMSPANAIRAATVTAAGVIGKEAALGAISQGLVADLIAVKGDPLADVSALREPSVVIKSGRVVVDRR